MDRASLIAEHRQIEAALDRLADAVAAGRVDAEAFRRARSLCAAHYEREEPFLAALHPVAAAKMKAQHEEALEIAARLDESDGADAIYLVRRFLAIAQHNIIEEERDVFPLAEDA